MNRLIRPGFADVDAFGFGFVARNTWGGNIDAPDYMPQGSVRVHNTIRHFPTQSLANRDCLAGCAAVGVGMDGPEPPIIRTDCAQ